MTISVDLEIIENLEDQFDDSDKCEVNSCKKEATWLIVTRCCGDSSQFCKSHFYWFKELCDTGDFLCTKCGHIVHQPATFNDMARAIPL